MNDDSDSSVYLVPRYPNQLLHAQRRGLKLRKLAVMKKTAAATLPRWTSTVIPYIHKISKEILCLSKAIRYLVPNALPSAKLNILEHVGYIPRHLKKSPRLDFGLYIQMNFFLS